MALVERMSASLQLPEDSIRALARKADHSYYRFTVPRRRGGRPRQIDHPGRPLKGLQRWLLHHVISGWKVHDAAFAYRKGRGIKKHAMVHVKSRFLLRMDLRDFFPSIRWADVQKYLETAPTGTEEWENEDRLLFGRLVCRDAKLTIGAPTSPALSNALCFELDNQLSGIAQELDLRYTRYADDFFFSSQAPNVLGAVEAQVGGVLEHLTCPEGLRVNARKTRHSSRRGRRQVTGLVLSSEGSVSVGRPRKRYIRRQLHRLGELGEGERQELAGLLSFVMDVEPEFINAVTLKYGPETVREARFGE